MEAGSEQITGGGPITGSLIALLSALFTERVFLTTLRRSAFSFLKKYMKNVRIEIRGGFIVIVG